MSSPNTAAIGTIPAAELPATEAEDGSAEAVAPLAPFAVVGVGASAGGLTALSALLTALPPDTGMAFVLVQHLAPQHISELGEILSKTTPMPVVQASDDQAVEPNHVYVIPPAVDLALVQGRLRLTPRERTQGLHLTIDFFLRSLAHDRGSRAIGVVLSGYGADGTIGLAEIKAVGGITFAQDPASAEHPEMPASAITHGHADFILTPAAIAQQLATLGRHPLLHGGDFTADQGADPSADESADGEQVSPRTSPAAPELSPPDGAAERFSGHEDDYATVLTALKKGGNIDLSLYRPATIKRRILRRMALRGVTSLPKYAAALMNDAAETKALLNDVLIKVTSFFRDQVVFDAIKRLVFPQLTPNGAASIRIWVVACATGQEAYSLAIELLEYAAGNTQPQAQALPIQIFATDISEAALATARAGVYPASIEAEVTPERLRRYFTRIPEGYRINKSIRDLCVFARHDITADTPFSKIDLISCRNVLIYLTPVLQERVIQTFCYTLAPNGFLLLGSSETVGRTMDLFEATDAKNRVYRKRSGACRVHSPNFESRHPRSETALIASPRAPSLTDVQRAADRIVLNRYGPAGVLVDSELNILQFRGKTADFLEPAQGHASLKLLKMVPHELATELARAIAEAQQKNLTIHRYGVRVRAEDRVREINLEISLVNLPGAPTPAILVLFEEPARGAAPTVSAPAALPVTLQSAPDALDYARLKQELTTANDYQLSLIEENNVINDELRFAHDEAVSGNEELRCANEELQTAKEEVESANEEMATLNDELRQRNVELTQLTDDLTNLLGGINLPVVMLDNDLRIRHISGPTAAVLNFGPTDLGRQVRAVDAGLAGTILHTAASEVMQSHHEQEVEVRDALGRWYSLRVTPYRTEGDVVTGTVATYIDIDLAKRKKEELRRARDTANAIVETVHNPLLVLTDNLRVHTANRAFCRAFSLPPESVPVGEHIYHLADGAWNIPALRELIESIRHGGGARDHVEITVEFPHLGRRSLLLNACRMDDAAGDADANMLVVALADVTEEKRIADALKATSIELLRSNTELGHFAHVASHDMQEPLRMVSMHASLLQRRHAMQLEPNGQRLLDQVVDGAERLQSLIHDILAYAHLDPGVTFADVDCAAAVVQVLENLRAMRDEAQAEISVAALPHVRGNHGLLVRMLQNLLANAIKFRRPNSIPHIRVSARRAGPQWWITVADDGIGIAPEHHEQVFGVFKRLNAREAYAGSGTGLAVCRKIIQLHGGEIQIESGGPADPLGTPVAVGTRVNFSVPALD